MSDCEFLNSQTNLKNEESSSNSLPTQIRSSEMALVSPSKDKGQSHALPLLTAALSHSNTSMSVSMPVITEVDCKASVLSCKRAAPSFLISHPTVKKARFEHCDSGNKPNSNKEIKSALLKWKNAKLNYFRDSYNSHLVELFFLSNDGNLMEMAVWRKKPTAELLAYHKKNRLEGDSIPSSLSSNSVVEFAPQDSPVVTKKEPQDQIVEKAKQEAYVVSRIAQLRKDGLWTEKRLPKVHEPARPKCHWDYLLEEMVWLSADFAQERKWKKAAAKKCAKMVHKYFQDKELAVERAHKEEEMRLKKIASFMAREVRTFWSNVEKLVHYKINSKHEEKKKKALDQQLSFIVDQTEKYSGMLAESMRKPVDAVSTRSDTPSVGSFSDEEFEPASNSEDDEQTICKEEDDPSEQADEVKLLQQEKDQTIDDLLTSLPPEYLASLRGESGETAGEQSGEAGGSQSTPQTRSSGRKRKLSATSDVEEPPSKERRTGGLEEEDVEYKAEEEVDVEDTLDEQEKHEGPVNHIEEIAELEAENEMSIEALRAKYSGLSSVEPMSEEEESEASSESESEGLTGESDSEQEQEEEQQQEVGLKSLLEEANAAPDAAEKADKQLEEATAVAEALQPKGFTLSSATVTTPVPFLLKHTLREYQHVGLDWLTTMYEKNLNGILADEMGLGKTIQTISLLAHLACETDNWGPHLIVVPTSVMLNWEMELKKWCPAFKILTYFGSQKERKMKRQGWTKQNAFHVCITSYKLVIQDHQSFRRKKWKYFILDEAQNIKNFKSKRWQLLLNFQSDRRLLLTGTPLQNNLMELWSLMHFLMPHVFASHREFKEWFSNPVTGMITGNSEYNDNIIKRLHKVLRPFILRRLKSEVEQQMPKKFEHVVMCRMSKRQRFLYEEFMSRTKTRETLAAGNFLSVINVLMQLRKVCNHPNLFEERPTVSPFMMEPVNYSAPSCCWNIADYDPFKHIDLLSLNLLLCDLELALTAFAAHRIKRFQCPQKLITEIDSAAPLPPRCPPGKIRLHVRQSNKPAQQQPAQHQLTYAAGVKPRPIPSVVGAASQPPTPSPAPTVPFSSGSNVRYQLIQHQGALRAIPIAVNNSNAGVTSQRPLITSSSGQATIMRQGATTVTSSSTATSTPNKQQQIQLFTHSGQQLLLTTGSGATATNRQGTVIAAGQQLASSSQQGNSNTIFQKLQSIPNLKSLQGSVITMGPGGRQVLRLQSPVTSSGNLSAAIRHNAPPATIQRVSTPQQTPQVTPQHTPQATPLPSPTHTNSPVRLSQEQHRSPVRPRVTKEEAKTTSKGANQATRSIFYLNDLEESRSESRKAKLHTLATLNTRKCKAYPIYGGDLVEVVTLSIAESKNTNWRKIDAMENFVMTAEQRLHHMKYMLNEFVFCVPAVISKPAQLILHHPDPSGITRLENKQQLVREILQPVASKLHCITNATLTQFPDPRLIQYDCGKLQILDTLLRKLKAGSHRVLIFTQMTKMLDVFEAFLNYHGHIYLRLDGTTKVQDRQILMERFNQDKRIFVFILSTRSGGIGVNLTGADTVIFYDSDWNPTMDAQAQDRCHRIGQTRDVHIYRLISEKSIEENILKKANQKRLLGNLAIEGGNFTTAYFKEQSIQDLFQVSNEQDSSTRMAELLDKDTAEEGAVSVRPGAFENALAAAEDETDVVAARHAMAEAAADLAEFDENIPLNDDNLNVSGVSTGEEPSKVEQEINKLMLQLTGVERFAMNVLERADEGIAYEQSRLELELEQQKREWELDRQRAIANNEEMMSKSRQEEMEEPLTVPASQVYLPVGWLPPGEDLETWMPPTPPRGAGDQYMESHTSGYSNTIIPEAALPPVVCKTNRPKRPRLVQPGSEGPQKIPKHEENYVAPRSMFDKYSSVMSRKLRGEIKLPPKCRPLARGGTLISIGRGGMAMNGGPKVEEPWLDWNNQEETLIIIWRLLLSTVTPSLYIGHTPNFELVSDQINLISRCFRSGRYCKMRYDHFVSVSSSMQQREGLPPLPSIASDKVTAVANAIATRNEKINKTVKTSRSSSSTNQATVNLCDNSDFSSEMVRRFSAIKRITNQKAPTAKTLMSTGSIYGRATKQAQMLEGQNIFWDNPLTPGQIASAKLERAKEKQKATKVQHVQFQTHTQQQSHIVHHQPTIQVDNLLQQPNQLVSAATSGGATQQIIGSVVVSKGNSGSVIMSSGSIIVSQAALLQGGMGIVSMASSSGDSMPQVVTVASLGSGLSSDFSSTSRVSGVHPSTAPVTSIGTKTAKLALQELRPASSSMVTVASLAGAKLSQPLQVAGFQAKGTAPRSLPNQLTYIRQHPLPQNITLQQHKQDAGQTIKRLQIGTATAGGQKLPVAVSGGSLQGITAIQVSQAGRAQLVKHAVGGTAVVVSTTSAGALAHLQQGLSSSGQGTLQQQTKTITRTVSEVEMNAILRRQQGKGGAQVAQVIGKPQRGTVVKGSAVGHLQLATTKGGAGSGSSLGLQIIQGGASVHKGGMQHIQVFKQVPQQAMHHLASSAHGATIGAKAVSVSAGGNSKLMQSNQQGLKQTIQVVSAGASGLGNAPTGSIRVSAGTGSGGSLTLPVSAVRMATPQLFSQVSAALQHGQTVTVPVRGSAGGVRLSQPIAIQTQVREKNTRELKRSTDRGQQISIQHQPSNQNNGKNQGGSQG